MRVAYLLLLLFSTAIFAQSGDASPIQVPEGWQIHSEVRGDLNQDKWVDYAFILQKNDENNRKKREDGYEQDVNPRRLVVYLSFEKGYKKVLETKDGLLPSQDSESCVTDPLVDNPLTIKKSQLWLKLEHFSSCGSWQMGRSIYQIRYKDQKFSIIGKETFLIDRATHDESYYSTNYLTNKRHIRTGINLDEPSRHKPQAFWETLAELEIPKTLEISQLSELP